MANTSVHVHVAQTRYGIMISSCLFMDMECPCPAPPRVRGASTHCTWHAHRCSGYSACVSATGLRLPLHASCTRASTYDTLSAEHAYRHSAWKLDSGSHNKQGTDTDDRRDQHARAGGTCQLLLCRHAWSARVWRVSVMRVSPRNG